MAYGSARCTPVLAAALLALVISAPARASGTRVADPTRVEGHRVLPLGFEPNVGQAEPPVKFLSRAEGYTVLVTPTEVTMVFARAVLRMTLVGAAPDAALVGLDALPGRVNYLVGSDPGGWRTNVATYARLKLAGVYPGVDLILHRDRERLEYDFVVAPGASPETIRLDYAGARHVSIGADGTLRLATASGKVRWRRPAVYQATGDGRRKVDGEFVRLGETVIGFRLGRYDPGAPLVIDPVLVYSTYLRSPLSPPSAGTLISGITVDAACNAYVTGSTLGRLPVTPGAFATVPDLGVTGPCGPDPCTDAFVAKLDPAGSALVYCTFFGGSDRDVAAAIAVDAFGDAYITGETWSADMPTVDPYEGPHVHPPQVGDVFVAKLGPDGSQLLFSTFLGGVQDEEAYGIAVDTAQNAYVTGVTTSSDFPVTGGAFQPVFGGTANAFLAKLETVSGGLDALRYASFFGGDGQLDTGWAIALDAANHAWATGGTDATNFPTTAGAVQTRPSGGVDAFVAEVDTTAAGPASLVYSTLLGGAQDDVGRGIALDAGGNVYVAGNTHSHDFPTTPGALATTFGGDSNGFVTKLDPRGATLLYSTVLGSNPDTYNNAVAIAVDGMGQAHVTGRTRSPEAFAATPGGFVARGHAEEAIVCKLDASGSRFVYATMLGGCEAEFGKAIALDGAGDAYVAGLTDSLNFPTTYGSLSPFSSPGGAGQSFVAKVHDGTAPFVDLAVVKLKAPKRVRLGHGRPSVTARAIVAIQNRGASTETITTLAGLVSLDVQSMTSGCPDLVASVASGRPQRALPVALASKQTLNVYFDVTFGAACVRGGQASAGAARRHERYRHVATLHRAVLDGRADSHPWDDVCPRFGCFATCKHANEDCNVIDPYPDGTIHDNGCGAARFSHGYGADVVTDVAVR